MEELLFLLRQVQQGIRNGGSREDAGEWLNVQTRGRIQSLDALEAQIRAADQQEALRPSKGEGFLRSAMKGATFGFNDELAGLADAAMGGDYRAARDAERGADRTFSQEHKLMAFGGEMLGGLIPALATAGAANPGMTATAGQLARQGAGYGLAAGAATGAGNAAELADVPREAAISGAAGTLLGGAFGAAAKPLGGFLNGLGRGARRIFSPEADTRAALPGILHRILPEDPRSAMAEIDAVRPGQGMLADLNPGALDAASSLTPTERMAAQRAVLDRNAGAAGRMAGDATDAALGTSPGSGSRYFTDGKEAEAYARSQIRPTARRLYGPLEQRYEALADTPAAMQLWETLTDPAIETVYRRIAPDKGRALNFRDLQATLNELKDASTEAFARARGNEGTKYAELARRLELSMEDAMPGFKAANRGYARTMDTMRAWEQAEGALRRDPRDIARDLAKMDDDAVGAYRMRVLDDLLAELRSLAPEANAFREALRRGRDTMEPQLRAVFGSEREMDRFLRSAEVEQLFRQTYEAFANSKTQSRQGLLRSMIGEDEGSLPSSVAAFFRNMGNEGRSERLMHAVVPRLTQRSGTPELARTMDMVEAYRRSLKMPNVGPTRFARGAGVSAGSFFGNLWDQ